MKKPVVVAALAAFAALSHSAAGADSKSIPLRQIRLLDDPAAVLETRFGKAPPLGIHPRILIGPKELISLRRLVQNTVSGKFVLDRVESYLGVLHLPGKPLAAVYDHLLAGDPDAFSYATTDWWKGNLHFAVFLECYDAMIRQDEAKGKRAGAALATLAKATKDKDWVTYEWNLVYLAFAYDCDFAYMTEEQRTLVRRTIASATAGRKPYGADMPSDWRNYNWMPRGQGLLLSALAIEGEPGYDASIYPSGLEVMRDSLHYCLFARGGPGEEMHYFHYGMQWGALAMVAAARRGANLFAEPHYRAMVNWLAASMEPFGDAFSMHQDSPNDEGGGSANYAVMKWVWPDDPVVDMVWRNRVRVGFQGLNYYGDWPAAMVFPSDPRGWGLYTGKSPQSKWGVDEGAIPPGYPDPVAGIDALNLPLSYWEPERGLLITRTQWGRDAMVLHFDINVQAIGGGSHFHCNSTMFTLSALGRKWAIDRGFHIAETKDNSVILIDGRGQGFFPSAGKTVEYREERNLTVAAGDASEPYHWMTNTRNRIRLPYLVGFTWEPDTLEDIVKKFAEIATVDKEHPWKDPVAGRGYTYRSSYNPVEKAFRTVAFRRGGAHSYVLIVDDIKKDEKSHQYDWLMPLADDLEIKSRYPGSVALGSADPKDDRRLLVKMLGTAGGGQWELENYEIKRSPETGDTSSFGMGKRLKFISRAIEPDFRVLLYPYREGSELPGISASRGLITFSWPGQSDRYGLTPLPAGRTEVRLTAGP